MSSLSCSHQACSPDSIRLILNKELKLLSFLNDFTLGDLSRPGPSLPLLNSGFFTLHCLRGIGGFISVSDAEFDFVPSVFTVGVTEVLPPGLDCFASVSVFETKLCSVSDLSDAFLSFSGGPIHQALSPDWMCCILKPFFSLPIELFELLFSKCPAGEQANLSVSLGFTSLSDVSSVLDGYLTFITPATGASALTTTALASSVRLSSFNLLVFRPDGGLGGLSTDTDASSADDICVEYLEDAKLNLEPLIAEFKALDLTGAGSSLSLSLLSDSLDEELSVELTSSLLDSEFSSLSADGIGNALLGDWTNLGEGEVDGSFTIDLLIDNLTGDFMEGDLSRLFWSDFVVGVVGFCAFKDSLELEKLLFSSDFLKSLFGIFFKISSFGLGGGSLHLSGEVILGDVILAVNELILVTDFSFLMECVRLSSFCSLGDLYPTEEFICSLLVGLADKLGVWGDVLLNFDGDTSVSLPSVSAMALFSARGRSVGLA